jgi:hypothetical protein
MISDVRVQTSYIPSEFSLLIHSIKGPFFRCPIITLLVTFTALNEPRMFIAVFTRARHWSLLEPGESSLLLTQYSYKIYFNNGLPLTPGLPRGLFPPGLPTKVVCALFLAYATYPAHLTLRDFVTLVIFAEEYRSWNY